ncbi:MAG: GTPase HflX [Omnitrophica bacterium GWA2_41_15]|nr:MAG: GTPase HflX [Omnitrophica bacterium GWA2_41_15]HAZ09694.1 GTPase HflX [Candidatus Omnitrophota bacterium]
MEKAVLVTVDMNERFEWPLEARAAELKELACSSGASVVAEILCHKEKPSPDLFIGKGKFEELCQLVYQKKANLVIFNNDLTPTQLRNIEKGMADIRTIDRTQLILDIFAKNARSVEGKVQIELAQLEYLLPRLTGKGIHLSRLGGGIGTRGPGEKLLEYDRRKIKRSILKLKEKLGDIEKRRTALRKRRSEAMLTTVAIIGYTNAGKTTLLNQLTNSKNLVANRLFSTLDPVARSYTLPNNQKVLFLDTVGFLHNLPHHLVEAFKSTLEEVKMADILLHVLDASSEKIHEQDEAVYKVLKELEAENKIVIEVLNKIDLVDSPDRINRLKKDFEKSTLVSSLTGLGMPMLIEEISQLLSGLVTDIKIDVPNNRMDLVNLIYENGKVNYREDRLESVYLEATIPVRLKHLI